MENKRSSCESHLERVSNSAEQQVGKVFALPPSKCLHSQKAIQAKAPVSNSDNLTNLIAQTGCVEFRKLGNASGKNKVRVTHNVPPPQNINQQKGGGRKGLVCVSPPPRPGPPHAQPPHPTRLVSPKSFVRFTEIVTQSSPGRFPESQH